MAKQILVVILRRDEKDLKPEEIAAVRSAFPGKEVEFVRTDPRDAREHAAQCCASAPAVSTAGAFFCTSSFIQQAEQIFEQVARELF